MISIKYFASLRDTVGKSEEQLENSATGTVSEIWQALNPDISLPENTLAALNQVYCSWDTEVRSDDELAFFPPVTGG
ncbi:MAG TPA: molybdopterin synthase sulfur carrier subunit [Gammaproteobacteria bacterium]|nr:molybdopterin synthase sulfur carrier subunit [Gammaproteobacteria bacterium]